MKNKFDIGLKRHNKIVKRNTSRLAKTIIRLTEDNIKHQKENTKEYGNRWRLAYRQPENDISFWRSREKLGDFRERVFFYYYNLTMIDV